MTRPALSAVRDAHSAGARAGAAEAVSALTMLDASAVPKYSSCCSRGRLAALPVAALRQESLERASDNRARRMVLLLCLDTIKPKNVRLGGIGCLVCGWKGGGRSGRDDKR